MNGDQAVKNFISTALECSIYICPLDPGLSFEEVSEAAKREGFQQGEIGDSFRDVAESKPGSKKWWPGENVRVIWLTCFPNRNPEYRSYEASDFVCQQLKDLAKQVGVDRAYIERNVIIERAVALGFNRTDTQAAVTILLLTGHLQEEGALLRLKPGFGNNPLPGDVYRQSQKQRNIQPPYSEMRARAYATVKDIIERRSKDQVLTVEPLDAFATTLERLGHGHFRMWWRQMVGELRRASDQFSPVSICVLSAALVEGALSFVVKHAHAQGLATLGSSTFKGDPRGWKIDDLVKSAAAGNETAILSHGARVRAESLIQTRQRIHAGRMLSEFPGGVPELRPDEARDAIATAEMVVRAVLDWLERYPPPAIGNWPT